jgi:hypothetical protein
MTIYQKKVSIGNFLKKGEDFKEGDILEIKDEGKPIVGKFRDQTMFLLSINGLEGNVSFNQTSINACIDAYGEDSKNWIGKKVKATKIKSNVAGKFVDVWYFAHPDAELTDSGFVLTIQEKDIPVVEEGIDVKNIPF